MLYVRTLCLLACLLPCVSDFRRTVIMFESRASPKEPVFVRGGVFYGRRKGCYTAPSLDVNPCAIPIRHKNYTGSYIEQPYNDWSIGDNYLDWIGAEPTQSSWREILPEGSPTISTSNIKKSNKYHVLNTYGEGYWLLDVEMDCSKTVNGFFEVKAFLNHEFEYDIDQDKMCSGAYAMRKPFTSRSHVGMCGAKNVFYINYGACEVTWL
ncbi:alpha-amylase-like isoform X2 [Biomphalaria glabrata]|uniref:Alpha-amylase-like isoform X2 n=1 Tax=Biomphalaria glabrata TaxID=6526 RepID=A0A9W3B874_BIOGL|nr:alpha-amylase-like isoform X2 [Biomphalaria glabrata]